MTRQEIAASEDPAGTGRSNCPVARTLELVGDRWTLLIVRDLLTGEKRYGELLAAAEHIPTNILAERLKRLERAGVVERVQYRARPPRYAYRLTADGRGLGFAVDALATWGLAHFPGTVRGVPSPAEITPAE